MLVNTEVLRDIELYKEFIKWASEDLLQKCTFMCYQSAYKTQGEYGLIVCDEIDAAVTPEYFKFMDGHKSEKLLCLTATLPWFKALKLQKHAPISFTYSTQQGQMDGILNKTKIWYVTFLLGTERNIRVSKWDPIAGRRTVRYMSENDIYAEMQTEQDFLNLQAVVVKGDKVKEAELTERVKIFRLKRKHFLANLETSRNTVERLKGEILKIQTNKVMMFTESIKQAEKLSVFTYHSKNSAENENLNLFNEGKIRELAVVKAVNRGVNIDGLNNVIMESYSGSDVEWQQRHGRCCRLEPIYTADIYVLIPIWTDTRNNPNGQREYTSVMESFKRATREFDLRYSEAEFYRFKA